MTQKNATPNKDQLKSIEKAGLRKRFWTVVKVLDRRLIIRNKITGEVKVIDK